MHQCLHVDDIVRLVIEETVNLERPSAISLACTRRTFEAAVMETLWGSRQTHLVDLLQWGSGRFGIRIGADCIDEVVPSVPPNTR